MEGRIIRFIEVFVITWVACAVLFHSVMAPAKSSSIVMVDKNSKIHEYKSDIRVKWTELMTLVFIDQGKNVLVWATGPGNKVLHIRDDSSEVWPELFSNKEFIEEIRKVDFNLILLHIKTEIMVVEIEEVSILDKEKKTRIKL
jgi:hypothetical protein